MTILQSPDDQELCYVNETGFRDLSKETGEKVDWERYDKLNSVQRKYEERFSGKKKDTDAKDEAKDETKEEEEPPALEEQDEEAGNHQFNRNEKKCRKALQKAGMKTLGGITRVTLKKRDGLIFVIDDPEVLNLDNSYAIFGELKLEDLNR